MVFRTAVPLLLAASSCSTLAGRDFESRHVESIKVGTTTRAEIEKWFGPPYQKTVMAPTEKRGVRRYVYAVARRGYGSTDVVGKSLVVDFDDEGRVVDLKYTEQGDPQPPVTPLEEVPR